jgi:phenylpropionate dioxygenase-like ring-hydroxylating dioxygenase large terminal subunit
MPFLRNAWYVVSWSEALTPDTPFERKILGEPLVFFRTKDGIAAISNVCPHRYAPLSLGKVVDGVHNPHGSGRIPEAAKVKAYTAVDKHSLVWIWMGDEPADLDLIPDFALLEEAPPALRTKRDYIVMDAAYEMIVENLLDLSHTAFLHPGTLGNEETTRKVQSNLVQDGNTITVFRQMPDVPVPTLLDHTFKRDNGHVDHWANMRWTAPSNLLNDTGVCDPGEPTKTGTGIFGAHLLTPETETSTHYHFSSVLQNPRSWGEPIDTEIRETLSAMRRFAFEEQDKVIIDRQQAFMTELGDALPKPVFLESDAGPVRFRRILDGLIAEEQKRASTSEAA